MSSRALRKLQKQQEHNSVADSDEEPEEAPQQPSQPERKFNAFDLLNSQEDNAGSDSELSAAEVVNIPAKVEPLKPEASKSKKKKKKNNKKKKQAEKPEETSESNKENYKPEHDYDEIDRALHELSVKQSAPSDDPNVPSKDAITNSEVSEELDRLLAVDPRGLNALNEMKKLFGNIVLENTRDDDINQGSNRRRRQQPRELDLGQALTGRYSPASRGQDLSGAAMRKNILMQSKDEWPKAPSGGLGMEMVTEHPLGVAEYKLVHNTAYKDVQRQFDMCVESMEPRRMIELLQFNRV